MDKDTEDIPSSSLALVDPPVIERVKKLVLYATSYAEEQGNVPWFVKSLIDEVMAELSLVNEDQAIGYLMFTAGLMKWAATGDVNDLPEALRADIPEVPALPSAEAEIAH